MAPDRFELLTDLLRRVSRSFYLTLKVLPGSVRAQIGLAYLLARATDTVADTELIAVEQRLEALNRLRQRILGKSDEPLDFEAIALKQGDDSERELLTRIEEGISLLGACTEADRMLIREVLSTITSGQELDLRRFSVDQAGGGADGQAVVVALKDDAELDDYTYRVAGCVGEFWTKICRANVFPRAQLDEGTLLKNAVRFGQGLQMINILRDLPGDLRQGRCYLPANRLAEVGLEPGQLLDSANEPILRPLYDEYLDLADAHLAAGWIYTQTLPWSSARVRIACALPIQIGARTIATLRSSPFLEFGRKTKISRREIKLVSLQSVLLYPLPFFWRRLYTRQSNSKQ